MFPNDTFYYCNLAEDQECPYAYTCKRRTYIKDVGYNDYINRAAKLYNICSKTNYKLYLKDEEANFKEIQEATKQEDKQEETITNETEQKEEKKEEKKED